MAFAVSGWIEFVADGALSDTLVTDFDGAAMNLSTATNPPRDWTLCVDTLEYGAAASVAVRIFLAAGPAAAADDQKEIVNVTAQYFVWQSFQVPRDPTSGVPWQMRITKAVTNANLGYRYQWQRPGGC